MSSPPSDHFERIIPKKDQRRPEKDRALPDRGSELDENAPGAREYKIYQFRVKGEGTIEFRHVHVETKKHDKVCEIKVKVPD
jgi:hypothetical protein